MTFTFKLEQARSLGEGFTNPLEAAKLIERALLGGPGCTIFGAGPDREGKDAD
jgi:hypothetical protein